MKTRLTTLLSATSVTLAMLFSMTTSVEADVLHENEVISSNTTWQMSDNDHIVVGTVTVNSGVTLTIEDGCIVRFDQGAQVSVNGTLTAPGSVGNGILFTRRDDGDEWHGLRFHANSSGTFEYCTIEYATNSYDSGAFFANSATSLSVQNCTIRHNEHGVYARYFAPDVGNCMIRDNHYGLYIQDAVSPVLSTPNTIQDNTAEGVLFYRSSNPSVSNQTMTGHMTARGALHMEHCGEFHIGTGNNITGNSWGLTMTIGSYPDAASAGNIPVAGNTNDDGIQVCGHATSWSVIWRDVGTDYIVTESPLVDGPGTLTIEDGLTVKFANGRYLSVRGTLTALGSVGDGILFTRRNDGDEWHGLRFSSGSSGSFEYCTVEYATHSYDSGAFYASSATSLSVENCTIRYNEHGVYARYCAPDVGNCTIRDNQYGLYIQDAVSPVLYTPNTIQDNAAEAVVFYHSSNPSVSNQTMTGHVTTKGALLMEQCGEFHIGTGNNITGNSWGLTMTIGSYPDAASAGNIPVAGNTNDDGIQVYGNATSSSVIWRDLGLDFIVTETGVVNAGGALTLEDGLTIKFAHGKNLGIYGTMTALGSVGDGILFTRRNEGDEWRGLRFHSNSTGTFEYCTIEYATFSYDCGAFFANSAASLSVQNCVIRYNEHGVYARYFTPDVGNCMIMDNRFGLYIEDAVSPVLSTPNTIQDNTEEGILLYRSSNPSVSNQTMTGHMTTRGALHMEQCGEFHIGTGNNITGNSWGLTMTIGSYPDAASAGNIPVAGNTNEGIQVYGNATSSSVIWRDLGTDYIVTETAVVNAGGVLTVEDRVTVKFRNGRNLGIYGTMTGFGSVGGGILFTRRNDGDEWRGLRFHPNSTGTFEYCTIEYASYSTDCGAFYVNSAASLGLQNCMMRHNDYGIYASDTSPTFLNCQITDNNEYGIYLQGSCTPVFGSTLSQWNDIHGNGSGNPDRDLWNGTEDLLVEYVYWGSVDWTEIQTLIHHELDDPALGLVTIGPFTNATHDTIWDPFSSVDSEPIPIAFSLSSNRPNPVHRTTTFHYALPRETWVQLEIFDISGRKVATVVDGLEHAGFKEAHWSTRDVGSGTYFYRLQAGDFTNSKKLMILR